MDILIHWVIENIETLVKKLGIFSLLIVDIAYLAYRNYQLTLSIAEKDKKNEERHSETVALHKTMLEMVLDLKLDKKDTMIDTDKKEI
jgi:hypothetical protein